MPGAAVLREPLLELRAGAQRLDRQASLHHIAAAPLDGGHYLIQFDAPLTPAQRDQLAARGIALGAYLPEHAYLVALPAGFALRDRLADLGFVSYVGEWRPEWKLDPDIGRHEFSTPQRQAMAAAGELAVMITLFDGARADAVVDAVAAQFGVVHYVEAEGDAAVVSATLSAADLPMLAELPQVQFIEEAPELTFRNSTTRWIVQSNVTNVTPLYDNGIHGENQIVGIMDGEIDTAHCSFSDVNPIGPSHRKILAYNAPDGNDSHGTHVGGTACGDANTNTDTRGIAYLGKLVYDTIPSFTDAGMYNVLLQHHNQGARLHTNSWGNDGTTNYDGLCRGVDRFSYDREDSLVLFAVTNLSALKNPENAKNLLAVGASRDTPSQAQHCSGGVGPTADGRRKPEIYAPGCSTVSSRVNTACLTTALTGTSMASPAVAGTAMLVRQYFTDGYYPSGAATPADAFTPTGALVKATLINASVDMTSISGYPSNLEGWGRVLAGDALYFPGDARKLVVVADVRNADGLMTTGLFEETIQVVSSGQQLRVTLAFCEPPAAAGAANPVINNIDLEVLDPSANLYRGNVFSGGVSITGGTADAKNNLEQVHVNNPAVGAWTIRVRGTAVNSGKQGYSVVATGDVTTKALEITLPNGAPQIAQPYDVTPFDVVVTPFGEAVTPGSPTLHYRTDGGAYLTAPLTPVAGTLYTAALPPGLCGQTFEFYVSAAGSGGTIVSDPPNAPAATYLAPVGAPLNWTDDFETDMGWTVGAPGDTATDGVWVRVDPFSSAADPSDDHTSAPGTLAYVTGLGNFVDVDGGRTTLLSPPFDLRNATSANVSFWMWYTNYASTNPNQDVLSVDISGDDGATWQNALVLGPGGTANGWNFYQFNPLPLVGPAAQTRIRIAAEDLAGDSHVEAGIDDVQVTAERCPAPTCLRGDLTGDGRVDGEDIARFAGVSLGGGATPAERCAGDVQDVPDGDVTTVDTVNFIACALAAGCP